MKVGTVTDLTLYPVKSMGGVAVERAQAYWYGFNGDRKYAFVRAGNLSGFPWLTAREMPRLLLYEPHFENPGDPLTSSVRVKMPEGDDVPLESPDLVQSLSEAAAEEVSLFRLKRGTFDCMPISLLTTQTLAALNAETGRVLDPRRFRANLVVDTVSDTADEQAFPEQAWLGRRLRFGDRPGAAVLALNYPTTRCAVVNLDPESGSSDPSVLKTVARLAQAQAGIYGTLHRLGEVRVGDPVFLT